MIKHEVTIGIEDKVKQALKEAEEDKEYEYSISTYESKTDGKYNICSISITKKGYGYSTGVLQESTDMLI